MSHGHATEPDVIAEIERLELEARDVRRRVEHARSEQDKRVLNRQLREIEEQVDHLRARLL